MALSISAALLGQPALSALAGSGCVSLVGRIAALTLPRQRRRTSARDEA
jgi:hypothetical protein